MCTCSRFIFASRISLSTAHVEIHTRFVSAMTKRNRASAFCLMVGESAAAAAAAGKSAPALGGLFALLAERIADTHSVPRCGCRRKRVCNFITRSHEHDPNYIACVCHCPFRRFLRTADNLMMRVLCARCVLRCANIIRSFISLFSCIGLRNFILLCNITIMYLCWKQ